MPTTEPVDRTDTRRPPKLAGTVLAVLGLCTHGSTCPWALVLNLEWMADRRRCPHRPLADHFGVALSLPLSLYWVMASVTVAPFYAPELTPAVIGYWVTFAVWVVARMFTRWRDIAADRRVTPARPRPAAAGGTGPTAGG